MRALLLAVCTIASAPPPGCAPRTNAGPAPEPMVGARRYFESPQAAVTVAADLIRSRDWRALTAAYDLSLTRTDPAELTSGRFFMDESASPTGPGAISRYKRPFSPGARLVEAKPSGDPRTLPCIWSVTTSLEIDQGGGMVQRRLDTFNMIQTREGFRFLPPAPAAAAPTPVDPRLSLANRDPGAPTK